MQAVTDGEFRRASWHMDFIYQLGGIREDEEHMHVQFHNEAGDIEFSPAKARVYDTVTLPKTIFGEHFTYLKSQVTRGVPKLTIPSPSMVHYRSGRPYIDTDGVSRHGRVLERPQRRLRAGDRASCTSSAARYLQMDDTCFAYLNDASQRKRDRRARRGRRAPAPALHQADQRGGRRPARRT